MPSGKSLKMVPATAVESPDFRKVAFITGVNAFPCLLALAESQHFVIVPSWGGPRLFAE